jgi:hypothetical protein
VNNREIATLVWLGIALALALRNSEIRRALWGLLRVAADPKLFAPTAGFAVWIGGLIVLAHRGGLWETDVRNDTVAWFLTVGLGLLFALRKVREEGFFRKAIRRALGLTVFVEAFMNLGVLPLPAELALLPLITIFALVSAFSEGNTEYGPAHAFANGVLAVIGACGFVYVVVQLVGDFDATHTARALALPVWLTLGSLPFVYAFGLVAEYEQAFNRIDLHTDDSAKRRRAKWALTQAAHVRASELGGFAVHWISDLVAAESSEHARAIARRWRKGWRAEEHAQRLSDARVYMEEWLTQTDPTLQDMWADSVHRTWDRLDSGQRAALKAEALGQASSAAMAAEVRSLPD